MQKQQEKFVQDWLTDPTVFVVNRLPAHSDHRWTVAGQTLTQPLDGTWQFVYSRHADERPAEFWQEGYDDSPFGTIAVPAHIEMEGYGQLQYINTMYPWDGRHSLRPPQIAKEDCPVGSYVRRFDLAPALRGGRVCVSFQGAEQALAVWCNGHFVGYSEDSFTPADFDLTPYLRETDNRLCAEVYKRSSAAWIEDQDFFRFFGLFRSVYLYAKPKLHLEDLWLRAGLEEDNTTGTLAPRLTFSAADGALPEAFGVACTVTAPGGEQLYSAPLALTAAGENVYTATPVRMPNIRPWNHATPTLYTVTLVISGTDGNEAETVEYRTGFRRFEMKDGVMLLNGQRVFFNGVNRHEWNPAKGRAIGPEDMHRAIETFHRANINAVRTCHYPNQTLWYELCDQNGIYMIDETNLESHGSWQKMGKIEPSWNVPGDKPEWRDCVVDRARSMLERDKNHTAVLLWSCGNESYAGADILAMSEFFHKNDPSRLVHYEGVFPTRGKPGYDPAWEKISDVESRMYAKPAEIRQYLKNKPSKPFLSCEYMHDMGNSLGGMGSYTQLREEFDQYQGGFIWDYMDQALWHTDALGRRVLGYGGDFGERPTDYAFSGNGIVFADGSEKPALQEVRYWHSDAATRAAFDDENEAAAAANAKQLAAAQNARAAAGAQKENLMITEGDVNLGVKGEGFEVLFSWSEHGAVSLLKNGHEWLYRAPRPVLWRAATENDKGCGFPQQSAVWLAADCGLRCTGHEIIESTPRRVSVCYRFAADVVPGVAVSLTYTVEAAGTMTLTADYKGAKGLPELPCFGVRLTTPTPAGSVEWTGLSGETYPDRFRGGRFGTHRETPQIPAYLVPQDCGCHVKTQAVCLHSQNTAAHNIADLALEMREEPFAFSALPNTAWELEAADHRENLPHTPHTHLTLYAAMRGVGGIDSWGTDVEEPCRVSAEKDYRLSVIFRLG